MHPVRNNKMINILYKYFYFVFVVVLFSTLFGDCLFYHKLMKEREENQQFEDFQFKNTLDITENGKL